jgi:Ankyrin repeats (3 copies)
VSVSHPGNVRLRGLAKTYRYEYKDLRNSQKRAFAKWVLDEWRHETFPPGRVVRKVKGTSSSGGDGDGGWHEVAEDAAVELVIRILSRRTESKTVYFSAPEPYAAARAAAAPAGPAATPPAPAPSPAGAAASVPPSRRIVGTGGSGSSWGRERRKPAPRDDDDDEDDDDNGDDNDAPSSAGDRLHGAIGRNEPLDVLKGILTADPNAIRRRNAAGRLPLHAAACSDAPLEVVRILTDAWEDALLVRDLDGKLPLHVAVGLERGIVRLSVVRFLVDKCPQALRERDMDGRLPLHVAAFNGAPLEVVQVLVDKCEQALQERDKDGNLPLHVAAGLKRGVVRLGVVRFLLERWDPAVRECDACGRPPLIVAAECDAPLEVVYLLAVRYFTDPSNPARKVRDVDGGRPKAVVAGDTPTPPAPAPPSAHTEMHTTDHEKGSSIASAFEPYPERYPKRNVFDDSTTKNGQASPSAPSCLVAPLHGLPDPREQGSVAEGGIEEVVVVGEPSSSLHKITGGAACAAPASDDEPFQSSELRDVKKPGPTDVLFGRGSKCLRRTRFCCVLFASTSHTKSCCSLPR